MPWKVKIYTRITPEEEEIFQTEWEAASEADQIDMMQPEGCENKAVVVECDDEGNEI